ncbi:endo alpha polygalactosaminidase precursor [Fusarium beomiforme]|uniref:alpha-galactosidase n=1 Tax=Fusarium beomiforme TaxID=44412 RepID=A0A9P5E236_9HYPO|nr:endo alpha polygalactosaminidase precursor [Fusarium beomiforme]
MKSIYIATVLLFKIASINAFSLPSFLAKRKDIWTPDTGDNWQPVLDGPFKFPKGGVRSLDPDISVYGLDLWSNNKFTINRLQKAGKHVICSFSGGTVRAKDSDKKSFFKRDIGNPVDGSDGEKWLNVRSQRVRKAMAKRVKLASDKGCDAISPLNTNAYDDDTGFELSEDDEIDYVGFLVDEAAKYQMSVGVEIGSIIADIQDVASFFIGGSCDDYSSDGDGDNGDDDDSGDDWDPEDPNSCEFWQELIDSGIPVFSTDGEVFKKSKV